MNEQRLKDWYDGKVSDDDLTMQELEWLQEAVFNAVARKIQTAPTSNTKQ